MTWKISKSQKLLQRIVFRLLNFDLEFELGFLCKEDLIQLIDNMTNKVQNFDHNTVDRLLKHYDHFKGIAEFHYEFCAKANAGQLPIPVASGEGLEGIIKFLVAYENIINEETTHEGKCEAYASTPLSKAIRFHQQDVVKILLDNGASMKLPECLNTTALHMAILGRKNAEIIELLLTNGFKVDAIDQSNRTPLILAIYRKNDNVAKLLIKYGANVNAPGLKHGDRLLHLALRQRNSHAIIELLLIYGADVNALNNRFETPLLIAIMKNDNVIMKNDNVAKLLIKYGANVNAPGLKHGDRLLHLSLRQRNSYAITESLLLYGADVNALNDRFETPLLIAIMNTHCEKVYQLLVGYGANIGFKSHTSFGFPLLHLAIGMRGRRNKNVINPLISSGSPPLEKIKNKEGDNALEYSFKLDVSLSIPKFLIYNVNK